MLPATKDFTSNPLAAIYARANPTFEMLFKEQEHLLKQANVYKTGPPTRPQNLLNDRFGLLSRLQSPQIEITLSKGDVMVTKSQASPLSPATKKSSDTASVQNLGLSLNDEDVPDDDDEITVVCSHFFLYVCFVKVC